MIQKEFINISAHELKTPIQSIIGFVELLESNPERSEYYILILFLEVQEDF